jgi:hypothetical protein
VTVETAQVVKSLPTAGKKQVRKALKMKWPCLLHSKRDNMCRAEELHACAIISGVCESCPNLQKMWSSNEVNLPRLKGTIVFCHGKYGLSLTAKW